MTRRLLPRLGAGVSGFLLFTAFPPLEWSEAAWLALVPLLLALRTAPPAEAARLGFIAGVVFWLLSTCWMTHVTFFGWIALASYCAAYIALFALFSARWLTRFGAARWSVNLLFMGFATAGWISLEWARSHLFTGFPWNTLAISQYAVAPLRQGAQWGGVYLISAVLVFFNAGIAITVLRYRDVGPRWGRNAHPELIAGFLGIAGLAAAGIQSVRTSSEETIPMHIGVVQTDIPQIDKWTDDTIPLIYERLESLTKQIQSEEHLDLVVWPETALPDDVRYSSDSFELIEDLVVDQVPILTGSMDFVVPEDDSGIRYFNSSFLFGTDGRIHGAYDKQHLVMFGEYIPFERAVPFLSAMTPNLASFTAGTTSTVFRLEPTGVPFASLICFEDTLPTLSRAAVRGGARLLINQTNDAWFEESAAPRQHMAHCVFRCVEHRVPAVRAANTGVSCFIDRFGTIQAELTDESGRSFFHGALSHWVRVPKEDRPLTFYTRHGDIFACACSILFGVMLLVLQLRKEPPQST